MLKNRASSVVFAPIDATTTDARLSGISWSAGDIQISKDGGAYANTTSTPTELGVTGRYSLALTQTETNANAIAIKATKVSIRPLDIFLTTRDLTASATTVYLDPVNGTTTGAGTKGDPVSTITIARTICDAIKVKSITIIRTDSSSVTVTLDQDYVGFEFIGTFRVLTSIALASRNVRNSTFTTLTVSGAAADTSGAAYAEFRDCILLSLSQLQIWAYRCTLLGTFSVRGTCIFDFCITSNASTTNVVMSFPASGAVDLIVRHFSGDIGISSCVVAGSRFRFTGTAQVALNASCTAGDFILTGAGSIANATAGSTVTSTGFLISSRLDAASSTLATSAAQSTMQIALTDVQGRIPATLISGRLDASVGAMAANTVTASALATDAAAEIAGAVRDVSLAGAASGSLGETLRVLLGVAGQQNMRIDSMFYSGEFLSSCRVRVFPDAATASASTSGGDGEGELYTLTLAGVLASGVLPSTVLGVRA